MFSIKYYGAESFGSIFFFRTIEEALDEAKKLKKQGFTVEIVLESDS